MRERTSGSPQLFALVALISHLTPTACLADDGGSEANTIKTVFTNPICFVLRVGPSFGTRNSNHPPARWISLRWLQRGEHWAKLSTTLLELSTTPPTPVEVDENRRSRRGWLASLPIERGVRIQMIHTHTARPIPFPRALRHHQPFHDSTSQIRTRMLRTILFHAVLVQLLKEDPAPHTGWPRGEMVIGDEKTFTRAQLALPVPRARLPDRNYTERLKRKVAKAEAKAAEASAASRNVA
ncbi:hypothetical protein BS47DRAFT_1393615 [Hydnum rufescens UP504]|uniref:Secreted protein n=1 Tax=Hydnum rufescens UP504 TaxID=1448309 RepID=A0A9P6DWU0_9AGAM|nr:hypothetical protein BS47DRAFT_1393615 [Hydnum rufescens UP504]